MNDVRGIKVTVRERLQKNLQVKQFTSTINVNAIFFIIYLKGLFQKHICLNV